MGELYPWRRFGRALFQLCMVSRPEDLRRPGLIFGTPRPGEGPAGHQALRGAAGQIRYLTEVLTSQYSTATMDNLPWTDLLW